MMYEDFFVEDGYDLPSYDLRTLKQLVKQGEGVSVEFKQKATHPEKICRGIVAFANTKGGQLIIGVADNKELVGLKFPDDDEFVLTRAIDKFISPAVAYDIHRITLENGRDVLIFDVTSSEQKPHYLDLHMADETPKAYVRVADKSIQASREVREIMKGQRKAKDVRFTYGDKEKALLQWLEKHQSITLEEYAKLVNIPTRVASRTLVLLTLANVLEILPDDEADRFIVKTEQKTA